MKSVYDDFFKHVLTDDPDEMGTCAYYNFDNFVQYIHPVTGRRRMYSDGVLNQAWDGSYAYGSDHYLYLL